MARTARRCLDRNGSTRAWRQLREQILARDLGVCVLCGEPATDVDHVIAVQDGGSDHRNLRSLCAVCHAEMQRPIV